MSVKTKEELMTQLGAYIGDDTSDEVLGLMKDISDTLDGANVERVHQLEQEKADLDKSWRERYRDTFLRGTPDDSGIDPEEDEPKRPKTFEDLFK